MIYRERFSIFLFLYVKICYNLYGDFMKDDKRLITFFVGILGLIILSYPITFLLSRKGYINISFDNFKQVNIETGFLSSFTNLVNRVELAIENRVTNYFPFYYTINSANSSINNTLDTMLYKVLDINYHPLNSDSQNEMILKDDEHFVLITTLNKEELDSRMKKQIDFFNSISNLNVNTYIYFANRYEFYPFSNINKINNMNKYYEDFKNSITNIKTDELKVNNKEEYLNYFYKTDHHFNMYGAYQGYKDIMTMMGKDYKEGNIFKVDGITYRGSMAKSSYTSSLKDNLYDIDIELENYKVLVNDSENLDMYKEHKIKKTNNIYYDHYVAYFNGMYGKVTYDFDNDSKDNLLILGDSFTWQIDNLIASHYDKTYIFNLKYLDYNLDLNKFIKENNITDVLFLYETNAILFDQYNYDFENRIVR